MIRTAATLMILCCATAVAQGVDTIPRTAEDSAIARARQLVNAGRESEGRRILDSALKAIAPETPPYAEVLYQRAALAATASDAERDYRRLLIEAPLSKRAEDATLQLAQLLQARGDRRGASDYLQRFMLSYAESPARPRVALSLVRLLFEQGPQMQARACEAYRMGREAIPPESLELRNQLDFYGPRCLTVAEVPTTPPADSAPTPPVTPPADSARKADAAPAPAPERPSTKTPSAFYSVQVAAYKEPEPARSLVQTLKARGIDARVDGNANPYRVRVGRYTTRAAAVKAAASLKAQGHSGFVTLVQGAK